MYVYDCTECTIMEKNKVSTTIQILFSFILLRIFWGSILNDSFDNLLRLCLSYSFLWFLFFLTRGISKKICTWKLSCSFIWTHNFQYGKYIYFKNSLLRGILFYLFNLFFYSKRMLRSMYAYNHWFMHIMVLKTEPTGNI